MGVYTLIPLPVKAVFRCQASLIIRDSPCGPRATVNAHSQAVLGPGVFHHRSREELRRYGKCPCRPSIVPKLMLANPISTQFPCCIYTPCPPSKLCQYCHRLYFIYCVVIARQCCLHNYVLNQKSKYTEVCILSVYLNHWSSISLY